MSTVLRLIVTASFALTLSVCIFGQDLGSSNKLFGNKKPPAKASERKPKPAKKATAKPRTNARRSVPKRKEPAKTTEKLAKGETEKPAVKKPVEQVANKKPAPTNTVDARFKSFGSSPKPEKEKPVSPADAKLYEKLILQGADARYQRNYVTAATAYLRAQDIDPRDARAVSGLGGLYADQQRWEDAEKAYRTALDLAPKDVNAHIALSYVLTQPIAVDDLGNRYEEAEKLARKAIDLAPGSALAYDQLGSALELRGFVGPETESAYRRAIQIDPSFAPPHAHLARLLRRRGMTGEATREYQNAIDRATDVSTRVLVAEVMQSEQRFAESEKLLRYALEEDPRNPSALVLLGRAMTIQGRFQDAEGMYRRAVDVSQNAYTPFSMLASLYLRQGKLAQAESTLFNAQRLVPESEKRRLARQFEAVGDAYFKEGSRTNAARCYRIASSLDAESSTLPAKLARTRG